jgi:hypothetical protein
VRTTPGRRLPSFENPAYGQICGLTPVRPEGPARSWETRYFATIS